MFKHHHFLLLCSLNLISLIFLWPHSFSPQFEDPPAAATPSMTPHPSHVIPTPIRTAVPIPTLAVLIPHTLTLDTAELENIQFITQDRVAYRQWGDLYIHHLITETSHLIVGDGDVTDFDWSEAYQQFAVAKAGRLLLIDQAGSVVRDLTLDLVNFDEHEAYLCHIVQGIEQDYPHLMEQITQVDWSPGGDYLSFTCDVAAGSFSYTTYWLFDPAMDTFERMGTGSDNDHPTWLNQDTVMTGHYFGGGNSAYAVGQVISPSTSFSVEVWGSVPLGSADGTLLAAVTQDYSTVSIFDTVSGQLLLETDLGDKLTPFSLHSFSHGGQYLALSVFEHLEHNDVDYQTAIMNIATGDLWILPTRAEWPQIMWLPDREQALLFDLADNTTYLSRVMPELRQIIAVGTVPDGFKVPDRWPQSANYLPLLDQRVYDARNPAPFWDDETAGVWLWDRSKGGLPYPIYLLTPYAEDDDNFKGNVTMFSPRLSPDETWLLVGQQVGWGAADNPYLADNTLQAIHLPSGQHHQITKWVPPEMQ